MDLFLNICALFFIGVEIINFVWTEFWFRHKKIRKIIDSFYWIFIATVMVAVSFWWGFFFLMFTSWMMYQVIKHQDRLAIIERIDALYSILFLAYFLLRDYPAWQEWVWIIGWAASLVFLFFWYWLEEGKGDLSPEEIFVGIKFQKIHKICKSMGWLIFVFSIVNILRDGSVIVSVVSFLIAFQVYNFSVKAIKEWTQTIMNFIQFESQSSLSRWVDYWTDEMTHTKDLEKQRLYQSLRQFTWKLLMERSKNA